MFTRRHEDGALAEELLIPKTSAKCRRRELAALSVGKG